jgi:hypothetical protein
MPYLLHIVSIFPCKDIKQCSVVLNYETMDNLKDVYNKLIEAFDDIPVDELPEDYKDFEDNYIQNYVDSPPIRFTIYDIEMKSFINTVKIRDIYNMYIAKIEIENQN